MVTNAIRLPVIRVNEIFGPTFQGEGHTVGKICGFIRVSGCNLTCSWCDTPFTWDWKGKNGKVYNPKEETIGMFPEQIVYQIEQMGLPKYSHIVFSGGEPMVQQTKLLIVMKILKQKKYKIEIETNGTVKIKDDEFFKYVDYINCSPKLPNSGMTLDKNIKPEVLKQYQKNGKNVMFKFVIVDPNDLTIVKDIVQEHKLKNIYIMAEGKTNKEQFLNMHKLTDSILKAGYNLSPRLHTLLWSDERGK